MLQIRIELPMEAIRSICRRRQISELAVFGAALQDDFTPEDRVEFLVEFEGEVGIDLPDLLDLQDEFATAIGRRVSLMPKAGLQPQIREHAASQALVIFTL